MTSLELTAIMSRLREQRELLISLRDSIDFLALATDRLAVAVEQRNALDLITTNDEPMPEPLSLLPSTVGAAA